MIGVVTIETNGFSTIRSPRSSNNVDGNARRISSGEDEKIFIERTLIERCADGKNREIENEYISAYDVRLKQ